MPGKIADRLDQRGQSLSVPKGFRAGRRVILANLVGRGVEATAGFLGRPAFIAWLTGMILAWVGWNSLAALNRFDPYPFVFLILILSVQASVSAPLILFAQRRQADRDRVTAHEEAKNARRSIESVEYLAIEIAELNMRTRIIEKELRRWPQHNCHCDSRNVCPT